MKLSRLLLISTISLVAATLPAQAASYKSTNGTTILNLNESGNSDFAQLPKNSGRYVTFIGGNRVAGGITILTRKGAPNNVTYTGTFEDYVGRPDTGCKGTIALNRTILVGGGVALRSEWRIGQSGSRCESPVGTKFVVNLVENLPVAKDGNYPGDPGSGSASDDYSWNHPLWKVTDSTSLNSWWASRQELPVGDAVIYAHQGHQYVWNRFGRPALDVYSRVKLLCAPLTDLSPPRFIAVLDAF